MSTKLMTQVNLTRERPAGMRSEMVCWVDADPRLKKGVFIHLKDYIPSCWKVEAVYTTKERQEVRTDWQVGGITETQH